MSEGQGIGKTVPMVPRGAVYALALGFMLLLLPQLQRLPLWLSLTAPLGCLWGLSQHHFRWRPLPRIIRLALMLALVSVFVVTHLGQITVNTAAAFFVLTVALKWTEIQHPRDVFVMFMILCYLAAVTFLFEQGIFWSIGVLLAVLVLFGSLQVLAAGGATVGRHLAWKKLGLTLVKVTPVVAVLFLIFPRLGPLWSVPLVSEQGSAGLSESMTPGEFADLARSSDRAFRVTFADEAPPASERYWRAMILDRYDGRTWHRTGDASGSRVGRINQSQGAGGLARDQYEVLMEPSYQPWAFALAGSSPVTANISLTEHGLVEFARPVDTAVRYRLQQTRDETRADIDSALRQRYTALPAGINPRTRRWAAALAAEYTDAGAFVDALMRHFRQEPFFYTLQPPALSEDSIDAFLFETRQGFCAHYASAAAFALRSVGIPARVIGGYLGGEYGLDDDYLIIRQYDAHAWVEAWLPNHGWVRLDPTAMVAPERVQQDWRQALRQGDSASADRWAAVDSYRNSSLMRWAGLRLDAANFYWQRFVVDYQGDTQRSLFGRFPGNPDLAALGFWTAGFLTLILTIAGVMVVRRERRGSRDPLVRHALRWQKWLSRRGLPTEPGQTPLQQATMAAQVFPAHRPVILGFARSLNENLYNPVGSPIARDLDRRWLLLQKVPRKPSRQTR